MRARGEEARELRRNARFKTRRWVVERTHRRLNRFRGILTRWETKLGNYVGMLHFACALVTLQQARVLR